MVLHSKTWIGLEEDQAYLYNRDKVKRYCLYCLLPKPHSIDGTASIVKHHTSALPATMTPNHRQRLAEVPSQVKGASAPSESKTETSRSIKRGGAGYW